VFLLLLLLPLLLLFLLLPQGALTVLPLRCLWALWQLLRGLLLLPRSRRGQPGSSARPALLPGAQLYDLLCAVLMLGALCVLSQIKPGVLYYWMKDITSEFLKIQVLFTALEILDKVSPHCRSVEAFTAGKWPDSIRIKSGVLLSQQVSLGPLLTPSRKFTLPCTRRIRGECMVLLLLLPTQILSNFGVDVLEALSSTCTLYTQSSIGLMQLLSDLLVAFLLITAHGSVLMCQVGGQGLWEVEVCGGRLTDRTCLDVCTLSLGSTQL
jgi:hypothetical protein